MKRGFALEKEYLIRFKDQEWSNNGTGVRSKVYVNGNQQIRLVEFSNGFVEPDWCTKGHVGYVLEGSCSIDFDGTILRFAEGDGLFIPKGIENKHKAIVGQDERVVCVLFENL